MSPIYILFLAVVCSTLASPSGGWYNSGSPPRPPMPRSMSMPMMPWPMSPPMMPRSPPMIPPMPCGMSPPKSLPEPPPKKSPPPKPCPKCPAVDSDKIVAKMIGADLSDYKKVLKALETESTRTVLKVTVGEKSSFCVNPDVKSSTNEDGTTTMTTIVYQEKCFGKVEHTCTLEDENCQDVRDFYESWKGQPVTLQTFDLTTQGLLELSTVKTLTSDYTIYDVKGIDEEAKETLSKGFVYANILASGKYVNMLTLHEVPQDCAEDVDEVAGYKCYRKYYGGKMGVIFSTANPANPAEEE